MAVSVGEMHMVCLAKDGRMYVAGSHVHKSLGTDDVAHAPQLTRCAFPRERYVNDAIFNDEEDMCVVMVSTTRFHNAALTFNGRVCCWGYGMHGTIGFGNELSYKFPTLHPPETFNMFPVLQVACGGQCTMAMTCRNIFTWGRGSFGQIGHGNLTSRCSPGIVPLGDRKPLMIAVGEQHSVVLVEDDINKYGRVIYTWGNNRYGALGIEDISIQMHPQQLVYEPICASPAVFVAAGTHLTAIVSENGRIYTCGTNEYGQLGTGSKSVQNHKLTPVCTSVHTDQPSVEQKFRSAACGGFHMIGLTYAGEAWTWGRNSIGMLGRFTTDEASHIPSPVDNTRLRGTVVTAAAGLSQTVLVTGPLLTNNGDSDIYTCGIANWTMRADFNTPAVTNNPTGLHHTIDQHIPTIVCNSFMNYHQVGWHHPDTPEYLLAFIMGMHCRLGRDLPPPEKPRRRESQRLKGIQPALPDAETEEFMYSKRIKGEEPDKYSRGMTCIYNGFDVDILKMICDLTRPVVSKRYEGIMRLQGART